MSQAKIAIKTEGDNKYFNALLHYLKAKHDISEKEIMNSFDRNNIKYKLLEYKVNVQVIGDEIEAIKMNSKVQLNKINIIDIIKEGIDIFIKKYEDDEEKNKIENRKQYQNKNNN